LQKSGLPVWMRIPYEAEIAAGIAAGKALIDCKPALKAEFLSLYERILQTIEEKAIP
jgi:hypothetical protein